MRRFRFLDRDLNESLIQLMARSQIAFDVGPNGVVSYHPQDEAAFEDVLIDVRSQALPDWQVWSCPDDWTPRYREELRRRGVHFWEEWNDGAVEFLLPRSYDVHSWPMG